MDKETIMQLLADGVISNEVAERYFPELKENEDEKVRKELITHCRNIRCVTEEGAERIAKWIAWLEKQGEKSWKPSDAQMASITCAVRKMKESACYDSELVSLYQDLKNLRIKL